MALKPNQFEYIVVFLPFAAPFGFTIRPGPARRLVTAQLGLVTAQLDLVTAQLGPARLKPNIITMEAKDKKKIRCYDTDCH